MTAARFIPAVGVSTEQDRGARGMVKEVSFDKCFSRRAEQCTTCTIVTNGIATEKNAGCPGEVFNTDCCFRWIDRWIKDLFKRNLKFADRIVPFISQYLNGLNLVFLIPKFHRPRSDKLHGIASITPVESVGLVVHITADQCFIIQALGDFKVSTMDINGVVHHIFI
ncbi:hypothetical protein D3C85_1452800 [compost metagenome]